MEMSPMRDDKRRTSEDGNGCWRLSFAMINQYQYLDDYISQKAGGGKDRRRLMGSSCGGETGGTPKHIELKKKNKQ